MKRHPSNQTPFAKFLARAVAKKRKPGTGIEINAELQSTMDVRFLCVAQYFPYMFERPISDLTIDCRWAQAFTQTCIEVDRALGNNTHGFSWRRLNTEGGEPHWYWSLAKAYDQKVRCYLDGENTHVEVETPWTDSAGALRRSLVDIVDKGMRRALAAQEGAANDADTSTSGGL